MISARSASPVGALNGACRPKPCRTRGGRPLQALKARHKPPHSPRRADSPRPGARPASRCSNCASAERGWPAVAGIGPAVAPGGGAAPAAPSCSPRWGRRPRAAPRDRGSAAADRRQPAEQPLRRGGRRPPPPAPLGRVRGNGGRAMQPGGRVQPGGAQPPLAGRSCSPDRPPARRRELRCIRAAPCIHVLFPLALPEQAAACATCL